MLTSRVIYRPEPPFIVEVGAVSAGVVWWAFDSAYPTEQDARGRADELAEHTLYVRVVLRHGEGRDRN